MPCDKLPETDSSWKAGTAGKEWTAINILVSISSIWSCERGDFCIYLQEEGKKAKDSEKQNSPNCLLKNEEIVDQL